MSAERTDRLVIVDRDGAIDHDGKDYVRSVQQWQPSDASSEALAALGRAELP